MVKANAHRVTLHPHHVAIVEPKPVNVPHPAPGAVMAAVQMRGHVAPAPPNLRAVETALVEPVFGNATYPAAGVVGAPVQERQAALLGLQTHKDSIAQT